MSDPKDPYCAPDEEIGPDGKKRKKKTKAKKAVDEFETATPPAPVIGTN